MRLSPKTSPILSGSQTGEFIGFLRRRSQVSGIREYLCVSEQNYALIHCNARIR
jgi:hypothetical protein